MFRLLWDSSEFKSVKIQESSPKMVPTNSIQEENLGLGKGLYAVFETNKGEIVCRLEEEKTPETVKNFVGLATGEKEYTDPKTGKKANEPFYNGTVFHRVI